MKEVNSKYFKKFSPYDLSSSTIWNCKKCGLPKRNNNPYDASQGGFIEFCKCNDKIYKR